MTTVCVVYESSDVVIINVGVVGIPTVVVVFGRVVDFVVVVAVVDVISAVVVVIVLEIVDGVFRFSCSTVVVSEGGTLMFL